MAFSGREDEQGEGDKDGECPNIQTERQRLPSADLHTEGWEVCSVCRARLSASAAPKLLPCLHTVCRSCATQDNDGSAKECQMCGQSFNLSEVTDCFIFEDSAPKCGGCEESALSGWCVQCEEALCSDCVLAHQRVKVTRNHTVKTEEPPSGFSASLRCASHRQERLKFFCLSCDELTCRDCQLINHRGHSFLLLEEALVSQKEQLQNLRRHMSEKRISVKTSLLDLDGRLHKIKEAKATAKKKLVKLVQSMHMMLLLRARQLFKEMEGLYDEEERSLMEMKATLQSLNNKQEHITAFIQKLLSTEGKCILMHKKQIRKRAEVILSQKTSQCETILQPALYLNQDLFQICKTFGTVKVTRVPSTSAGRHKHDSKPNDAPKEDGCPPRVNFKSDAAPPLLDHSKSSTDREQSPCGASEPRSLKPAQPTQVISDSVLPLSVTSDHVQPKAPSVSCTGTPSVSTFVQAPQPVRAHASRSFSQATLTSASLPSAYLQPSGSKKVERSLSHPHSRSRSFIPGQSVLKNLVWVPATQSKTNSVSVQPQPLQSGSVPADLSRLSFTSSMAHHSASLHTASSQSSRHNDTVTTQSSSLTLSQPGSNSTLALSNQAVSNPQPSLLSQLVSIPRAPAQALQTHWPPRAVPTSGPLPVCQVPTTAQTVILQHAQPVVVPPSPIVFTILKDKTTFRHFTPTMNQTPLLTYAPQPTLLLTAPAPVPALAVAGNCSAPNIPTTTSSGQNKKWNPMSNNVSSPNLVIGQNISVLPGSSNVYSKPPLHTAPTPCASNNPGQREYTARPTQKPQCELPVQAPADSVCERDISMHYRASPAAEEPDDNLPTSTVSETDTRELQQRCLSSPLSPNVIATVPVSTCPSIKSSPSLLKLSLESTSTSEHLSSDSPTSQLQLLLQTDAPSSRVEDVPIVPIEEALPTSDSPHVYSLNIMDTDDDEEEETDISDSEPVELEGPARISERGPKLTEDSNRSLCVSLLRLPISLPASGSDMPQFHIVSSDQTDEILVQETQEGQSRQRRLRIPALPDAISLSRSSTPDFYPQLNDLLDCAVCLSAGATLICAECGRSFHANCHVPPVLVRPIEVWVCSLCQDVFDDADPFSRDRLTEPYLSLQDQRKCEQLLLTLMCEEHSYLLYKISKRAAGSVGFDFIRGRLLGKRTPPYRSAAEMVSDLWALFDILSANSKKIGSVIKLQNSFQERLNVVFSQSLHASLLRPPGSKKLKRAPETGPEKGKTKTTLKRMREFLAANRATGTKRPCPEDRREPLVNKD